MSLLAGAQVMLLSYFLLEVGGGVMSLLAGAQVAQVTQVQPSRSTPVSLCEWPWCHGPARAASRFSLHCRLIWCDCSMWSPLLVWAVAACLLRAGAAGNMNGAYFLSDYEGRPVHRNFTDFEQYPRGTEYFDVYSPVISTKYSQVYWTQMDVVQLPPDIVKRFDGKVMSVVGFEIDQVFHNEKDEDVSVPINVAYNHHFESHMIGKNAVMEKIHLSSPEDPRAPPHMGHGRPDPLVAWVVRERQRVAGAPSPTGPSSQAFGDGNGGEYRKSWHGYAPGYAQSIESPTEFYITPMQIDTWHREKMNLTGSKFVSGPVPRNSLAPTAGPDALYSGLLECPVTTRIRKTVTNAGYETIATGTCPETIVSAAECFQAAAEFAPPGTDMKTATGNFRTAPSGCSIGRSNTEANEVSVIFNTNTQSPEACGKVNISASKGSATSLVQLEVELSARGARITMTGPAYVWFGVGFDAATMGDLPYTIIIDGHGDVTERKLGSHAPGTLLKPSVHVESSTVSKDGKTRTVVLTRRLTGVTSEHYTFDLRVLDIPFINAYGSSATFGYHKDKTAAKLSLLPVGPGACLCSTKPVPFGQAEGSLNYGNQSIGFTNHCKKQPSSDLLHQKNPTCDLRTYVGGQTACHHLWYLLDADQEIPWNSTSLEYRLKFRFHFQPYDPTFHRPVVRETWGIASPVEYDVPQCPAGTPTEQCVHKITGTFTVGESNGKNVSLVRANFHCHAPTCLGFELYHNDTGELICRQTPLYGGKGIFQPRFNEPGYIAIPPCVWGNSTDGLRPPVPVSGQAFHAVKYANSTYGHHGEMAWMQVHLAYDEP